MIAGTLASLALHPNAHLTKIYKEPGRVSSAWKIPTLQQRGRVHAAGARAPHGLMTSVFLMERYHYSVVFEDLRNIGRCEPVNMRVRESASS